MFDKFSLQKFNDKEIIIDGFCAECIHHSTEKKENKEIRICTKYNMETYKDFRCKAFKRK